ncbi:hypothetical protein SZ25_00407 [Candidatus Arcanobacter lacustris]|uniref:DnaA N-terminal domain-containing protein n=1 Tax=Candidatus Arcanibacter lacustris TaxID=1607817 RepID=A0A0F5MP86_9RICK|nr:hypothetical protein SZ25_00407 [Candidatus Arcanobacter lacustris]
MTKLLIEESCLMFQPSLAKRLGLNEAIILQQLHYWTVSCKKNQEDGHVWIYNTYSQWQNQFYFWSEVTVKRAIKSLETQGIIFSKAGKNKQIKTKYYTINYSKVSELNIKTIDNARDQIDQSDRSNRTVRQVNLISSINIETKTTTKEYLSKGKEENFERKNEIEINLENSLSQKISKESNLEREMIDIWNDIFVDEGGEGISLTFTRKINLRKAANYFKDDLDKWTSYCQKISSSKFLMGEVTNFKASIDWCIKEDVIIKILEDSYKCGDRVGGKSPLKQSIIEIKPKSSDPLWLEVVEKFKQLYGEAITASWLSKLDFEIIDPNIVILSSESKFILNYVENKYLNQLKKMFKDLSSGKIDKVILNNTINTKNICNKNNSKQENPTRLAC